MCNMSVNMFPAKHSALNIVDYNIRTAFNVSSVV